MFLGSFLINAKYLVEICTKNCSCKFFFDLVKAKKSKLTKILTNTCQKQWLPFTLKAFNNQIWHKPSNFITKTNLWTISHNMKVRGQTSKFLCWKRYLNVIQLKFHKNHHFTWLFLERNGCGDVTTPSTPLQIWKPRDQAN